jgi:hypothetical protein
MSEYHGLELSFKPLVKAYLSAFTGTEATWARDPVKRVPLSIRALPDYCL